MKFCDPDEFLLRNRAYLCLHCLIALDPVKVKLCFPWIIKKPGIFEGLIYWAITEWWAEDLSLSGWSVSYIHDIADAVQANIHGLIDTLFVQ